MEHRSDDVDRELDFHLNSLVSDCEREGIPRVEAIRRARLTLGGALQIREACVEAWTPRWLSELRLDMRGALRALLRAPGFSISFAAVVMLAVGPSVALFSLAERVLLGGMAVPNQKSIVELGCRRDAADYCAWSYDDLLTLKGAQSSIELFGVGRIPSDVAVLLNGQRHLVPAILMSANAFSILRISPHQGRFFIGEEDEPGATTAAIVSYSFWREILHSDPSMIGRQVDINGHLVTIVGVTPQNWRGFSLDLEPSITLPLGASNEFRARGILTNRIGWLQILGRLRPGESLQAAQTSVPARWRDQTASETQASGSSMLAARVLEVRSAENGAQSALAVSLRPSIRLLTLAAALTLLSCAINLCGISTSHVLNRIKEFALRRALGAGFVRISRRILLEMSILALVGGVFGAVVGRALVWLIQDFAIGGDPIVALLNVAWNGLAAAAIAIALLVLAGSSALAAALAVRRQRVEWLSQTRIADGAGPFRRILLVAQVAIAVGLLITGLASLQGLLRLERQPLGFDVDHMVAATLDPGVVGYGPEQSQAYLTQVTNRLLSFPGVSDASVALVIPGEGSSGSNPVKIAGTDGPSQLVAVNRVGAKYFSTIGARLLAGREFTSEDAPNSGSVVINRLLAEKLFGSGDGVATIGERVAITGVLPAAITVVGVVENIKDFGAIRPVQPAAYLPFATAPRSFAIVTRIANRPDAFGGVLGDILASIDRNVPVRRVLSPKSYKQRQLGRARLVSVSITSMSIVTMVIVSAAIFGMVNLSLASVLKEIAIRRALGADTESVVLAIGKDVIVCVLLGIVLGFAGVGWQWPRASTLMGLPPFDVQNAVVVSLGLLCVTAAAVWRPARAVLSDQFAHTLGQ